MRGILRKSLIAVAAVALTGLAGCAVYVPGPAVYTPGLVIGPGPVYVGGYYPHRFGYYGYGGFGYRGYYGRWR